MARVPKSSILLAGTGVWKISSGACWFIFIKIDYSDYTKSLNSRINEVYAVCFAAFAIVIVVTWFLRRQRHVM